MSRIYLPTLMMPISKTKHMPSRKLKLGTFEENFKILFELYWLFMSVRSRTCQNIKLECGKFNIGQRVHLIKSKNFVTLLSGTCPFKHSSEGHKHIREMD